MNLENIFFNIIGFSIAGFLAIILFIIVFFMGTEGRFHFKRGLRGGGIDLLLWDPMSKTTEQTAIKWDGKFWRTPKKQGNGIWLRLNTLPDPNMPEERQYNDAITSSSHWDGCHRPILLATEELGITLNFETGALITKSKEKNPASKRKEEIDEIRKKLNDAIENGEDPDEVEDLTKKLFELKKQPEEKTIINDEDTLIQRLKNMSEAGIKTLRVIQPISLADLATFIQGSSAMEADDDYELGKSEGIRLATQPRPIGGGFSKWIGVIILAVIVIVAALGLMWLIQSGTLQKILPK